MARDTDLVINIMTGVVTFRNEETDAQVTSFPISRLHATMIERGELNAATVCAAIKAKMMANEKFDFDEYNEGLRKLNVRKSALHAEPPRKVLSDRSDEMVSDDDISAEAEKAAVEDSKQDDAKSESSEPAKTRRAYTRKVKADDVKVDDTDFGI